MDPSPSGSEPPPKSIPKVAKIGWRAMLIFNLGFGAYIFAKKHEMDMAEGEKKRSKKGNKGAKKGLGNTEVEKNDAENSEVAETDKTKKPEIVIPEKEVAKPPIPEADPLLDFTDGVDQSAFQTAATEFVKLARKPIPEDDQRELFKWILEEKRKIEPKDRNQKKQIDEEKAVLKQFICAERIPKLLPDDSVDSSLRDWDKFFSK